MKKILAFFFILIFCFSSVSAWEKVENMRIGIYYGANARSEYILSNEAGFDIGYYENREFVSVAECRLQQIKISCGEGSFVNVLNPLTGEIIHTVDTSVQGLGIEPEAEDETEKMMKITAKASGTYRGGFEFKILSSGTITAVNVVPLDSYIYGVISREMSPSWHIEALKAQAVCARNFALGKTNRHKEYGFDLCNTVCCQAYSGVDYEAQGSYAPVDETSGKVLLYNDELVQTVYSSSMGETTENVKNVWGSNFPYLVSVSNEYEDTENINNGKWEKTLTKERATEIMNSKGYDIGNVTDIIAREYSDAGRVIELEVKGTKGSQTFKREQCRTIFSEATLSQKYTISGGGKTAFPEIYVLGANGTKKISLENMNVLGKGTVSVVSVTDGKTVIEYKGTKAGEGFVFTGEGWGHGVGMSQYGAKGMAEAGFTYEEILTHYYQGTHLENF